MRKLGIAVVSIMLLLLVGCATVLRGTTQSVSFDSSPKGAKVFLDGKMVGTTPFTMEVKKSRYKSFRVELDGYITVQRDMAKSYDLISLLNIFWDMSTTDLITGAAFEYAENAFFIELQPK